MAELILFPFLIFFPLPLPIQYSPGPSFHSSVYRMGDRPAVNRLTSKLAGLKASAVSNVITGLNVPVPELTWPFDVLWCPRFSLQTQSVGGKLGASYLPSALWARVGLMLSIGLMAPA